MAEKSIKDRVKEVMDKKGLNVAVLSRETNIPSARIYKWYKDDVNPKGTDSLILEQWLKKIEEVPHGTLQEPQTLYGTTVENLTDSVKYLSKTEMINAENIRRLITLLEMKMGISDATPANYPISEDLREKQRRKASSEKQ